MAVILAEIRTPATMLKGYLALLGKQMLESGSVSSHMENLHQELSVIAEQIINTWHLNFGVPYTEEALNRFVAQINPIIDILIIKIEELDTVKEEIRKVYPKVPDLPAKFYKTLL